MLISDSSNRRPLYPRLCPEWGVRDFHDCCIPGFPGKSRGIFMAELRALLHTPRGILKMYKKHTEEGHDFLDRRPLYPRLCPGKSRKPRIQRLKIPIVRFPRGNRERCHIWPRGVTFSRFPGFLGIFPGPEMSDLALQRYFLYFLQIYFCKSARSTGILGFQRKSKSICNGFDLTALLFRFSILKIGIEF